MKMLLKGSLPLNKRQKLDMDINPNLGGLFSGPF